MAKNFSIHPVAIACGLVMAVHQPLLHAQQAPNSGTLQPQPSQLSTLPAPGAPQVRTPPVRHAAASSDVKITPSAFRFTGNTLVPDSELQAVVAKLKGKEVDFNALADAAASLRQLYAAKGFVLTDVYLPEQSFAASGGVVEFSVIEARIGAVRVKAAPGSGVSEKFAQGLADAYLRRGALVSQYMLDRPVLLLRDMAGSDAEATVSPGSQPGEANVDIQVSPRGKRYEPYVAFDNMGARSAGEYRVAGGISVNAPLGMGDVFSARVQAADSSGNTLYRLSYGMAVGPLGTKLNLSATSSEYALGKQFESLGATGKAEVIALSTVHPLIRGRFTNLFASASVEAKTLNDDIQQSGSTGRKRISLLRVGILGNHADRMLAGGATSVSVTLAAGDLSLDSASALQDIGTAPNFGPRTAGNFQKLNVELQRVQYLSDRSSVLVGLIGQVASKNLTSAEKLNVGGPQGVRGYPIGEGIGDEGAVFTIEYRYQTGLRLAGELVNLTAFYDYGSVRRDKVRDATTLNASTVSNKLNLDSAGVGLLVGREGNFVMTAALASRIGDPLPTTGDPDSRPRLWLTLQKWF